MIYLDHCATTPLDPAAAEVMARTARDCFGNPGSLHTAGRRAAKVLADSRGVLAESLGARPSEILLTSSGTEANNVVIATVVAHFRRRETVHIVTTPAEHASIYKRLEWEARGDSHALDVSVVAVDRGGRLDADALRASVRDDTRLISVLHCNNETGVLQDLDLLREIKLAHPRTLLHLDIVQSYLRAPFDTGLFPADFLTAASHKVHGPKGAAFLYVRDGLSVEPLLIGGAQEKFRRAGTEDVAAVAGFAEAVRRAPHPAEYRTRLAEMEAAFLETLAGEGAEFRINGPADGALRMPGIVSLAFPGVRNKEDLLIACDLEGLMISSTSACHSGVVADSHVLRAMGVPETLRNGSVRLGFGRTLGRAQVIEGARILARAARRVSGAA